MSDIVSSWNTLASLKKLNLCISSLVTIPSYVIVLSRIRRRNVNCSEGFTRVIRNKQITCNNTSVTHFCNAAVLPAHLYILTLRLARLFLNINVFHTRSPGDQKQQRRSLLRVAWFPLHHSEAVNWSSCNIFGTRRLPRHHPGQWNWSTYLRGTMLLSDLP